MTTARRNKRKGNVIVLVAFMFPILVVFGAFAIDAGYISYAQSRLQAGADAAAMAGVEELPISQSALDTIAMRYAELNAQAGGNLQVTVHAGTWDEETATFTQTSTDGANAVSVDIVSTDNSLFFGKLLGKSFTDLSAAAIANRPPGGIGSRFLIDDEMIDKDVPSIEQLANSLGRDVEELVTPRGFNQGKEYGGSEWTWEDNFLDIPAGSSLTLPTGQGTSYDNNDAGMFAMDHPDFPFSGSEFAEFVMYSETGGDPSKWGTDHGHIATQLDPLVGASPVTDSNQFQSFVNPDFIHISPVFSSDISTLNKQGGVPRLNAKGLRRGLIAFKIMSVGNDIDGNGSVLPELVIEVVDPSTIQFTDIKPASEQGGTGKVTLVD